jgi:hypothetical protein
MIEGFYSTDLDVVFAKILGRLDSRIIEGSSQRINEHDYPQDVPLEAGNYIQCVILLILGHTEARGMIVDSTNSSSECQLLLELVTEMPLVLATLIYWIVENNAPPYAADQSELLKRETSVSAGVCRLLFARAWQIVNSTGELSQDFGGPSTPERRSWGRLRRPDRTGS